MHSKQAIPRVMIGLAALLILLSGCTPPPTPTPTPTPTATLPPPAPTSTPIPTPTDTPAPTPTDTPEPTPTDTPEPTPTDTPVPPPPTEPPPPDPLLIDNCEDGDNKNLLGGYWFTYDDSENGGTSEVVPPAGSEFYCTAGVAQMTGRVTTDFEWGFVGMGTNFAEPQAPRDISGYRGVSFWVNGDGKQYRIAFPQASIGDFDYHGMTFRPQQGGEWKTILFSDLRQDGFGGSVPWTGTDIYGIQWQTVGQPHNSISLAIDELRFVQ